MFELDHLNVKLKVVSDKDWAENHARLRVEIVKKNRKTKKGGNVTRGYRNNLLSLPLENKTASPER